MASFRSAISKGARRIEGDVRRTRDGVWVFLHDPTLKRTTGHSGRLSQISWRRLSRLSIPTVPKVLSLCRDRRTELFLDFKEAGGEKDLFVLLRKSRWLHQTRILAGSLRSLRCWRKILPAGHPLYWVTGFRDAVTVGKIRRAQRMRLTGFVVYKGRIGRRLPEEIRQAGLELYVWTIRTVAELRAFARLGVHGMMSEVWPPPALKSRLVIP